jgi:hypothetical protein
MSTHVHTQSPLMSMSAGAAPAAEAREVAELPMAGFRGAFARFSQRFMAALVASRAAQALAEIEAYEPRVAAELRAAMDRGERPFN